MYNPPDVLDLIEKYVLKYLYCIVEFKLFNYKLIIVHSI